MSVRIGEAKQGTPYQVQVTADAGNSGSTFVMIRWIPGSGHGAPKTIPLRLDPGQSGSHGENVPPMPAYWTLEVELNVPEPNGKAALTFTGTPCGTVRFDVTKNDVYWAEIVS